MKHIFLSIAAMLCMASAQSCQKASAETAPNVAHNPKSITILHEEAEFTAYFDQHLVYQIDGKPPVMVFADVFQQDGCWIAQMSASDYVRIYPATGNTNAHINGKTYIFSGGMMPGNQPQPVEVQRP